MSLNPGGDDDPARDGDPFADPAGPEPDAEPGGLMDMLRSSKPPVAPADVSRDMGVGEPWHSHAGAGFLKMTGNESTEAWMHLLMAAGLLIHDRMDEPEEPDDQDEIEGADLPADDEIFHGPQ